MPEITDERPPEFGPEDIARRFHEAYERLAPSFGYETRRESAVPWEDVPEANRRLMVAVAAAVVPPAFDELLAEVERLRAELTRFEGNAEILSASTVGEAFDRIEQTIRERDEARAELAKAREALTELATINPSAELRAKNRLREAEAQTVVYGISVNEWDRLWKLVKEIHRSTTSTPPTPAAVEAASTVPADAVTALRDAGILACGTDQTRDEEAL